MANPALMSDHGLQTIIEALGWLYQYGVYSREELERLKRPETYSDLRLVLDQAIDRLGAYFRRENEKS
jgi:hypothetical protein